MRRGIRSTGAPAALVAVAALAWPATGLAASFDLGVAAGEVTSSSARIWGHAKFTGKARAEVATDRRFKHVVSGKSVKSKSSNDETIQLNVTNLKPDERYYYRFCKQGGGGGNSGGGGKGGKRRLGRGGRCSDTGTFATAPKASSSATVQFAYTGDTDGTPEQGENRPAFGNFEAFRSMMQEGNDFNIHLGDTIYSDSGVAGKPARTVQQKWGKYRENLGVRNLVNLRRSAGFYSHWDDHEFINDFSIPEDGRELYRAGVGAFRDYAPVGYSRANGLYRTFRWGNNLELFFLDERSFRSAKASVGGVCDNPETGEPDLAPTAPQSTRNLFSAVIPSLDQPVSEQCKQAINDPSRTLLGERQFSRFLDDVAGSDANWKIVVNETPIQQFYGLPYDRWEGYAFERVELLRQLEQRNVSNLVFITTDTHANFVNVIRHRTLEGDVAPSNAPAAPSDTPYMDFITGPVATNPFWPEIDEVTGQPGSGVLISQGFFKPEPPNGVGMDCAQGDQFSYAEVEVSAKRVKVTPKTEDGGPVMDVDGERCGPYTIR